MKPQSNPVAGFYPINNLRIMPENSNCSSLVDDEAVEVQACRRRSRTSPGDAVDGQCRFFGLVPLERKKKWRTCCATRGAKTTRVGKSRYSSFTSSYRVLRLSIGRNSRAVPIARLFKIAQF